jgi:uncharacterized protein YfaS (alpha-2-macroglobulin family)
VLVLDYLQRTGQANPEVQLQAEQYVSTGYQRLLTFEVPGGGFSLFGQPPAEAFLTTYGLFEFHDMAQVYPVDEALIERTARWLLSRQAPDGTWSERGYSEHWQIDSELPTTAYIAWALIEAGYANTPEVGRAIDYIREFALQEGNAYSLALAANALAAYDPRDGTARAVLDRLYEMRVVEGDVVYWTISGASFMGATGPSGSVETTALAAYALMQADVHADAVSGALSYLIQGKDSWGTWATTQATILSLKALLLSMEAGERVQGPATVRVSLNGERLQEITIDESNADVVHQVTFDGGFLPGGGNRVQIEPEGGGNLMYQVATSYYLPWSQVPPEAEETELIAIDLDYDRTTLAVNDEVTVNVNVRLQEGTVKMALVDLGVPPGFTVAGRGFDPAGRAGPHCPVRADGAADRHLPGGFLVCGAAQV